MNEFSASCCLQEAWSRHACSARQSQANSLKWAKQAAAEPVPSMATHHCPMYSCFFSHKVRVKQQQNIPHSKKGGLTAESLDVAAAVALCGSSNAPQSALVQMQRCHRPRPHTTYCRCGELTPVQVSFSLKGSLQEAQSQGFIWKRDVDSLSKAPSACSYCCMSKPKDCQMTGCRIAIDCKLGRKGQAKGL